ncbi:MAG: CAP domain-containing protein [Pyrinomonadaceae bacterium]
MDIVNLRSIRTAVLFTVIFVFAIQIGSSRVSSRSFNFSPVASGSFGWMGKTVVTAEPTIQERDIFILVNLERKKKKLSQMKWDQDLWKMAEYYSRKMADEKFFDHLDPDGKSVVDRAKQFKIKNWKKIGENLFFADGYISPTGEAVEGWMNSEGHRENILDGDWTHSAIGVYEARGRKTYVTQVFLRR